MEAQADPLSPSGPGATQQRSFAIEKLRRAASLRELRNKGLASPPLQSPAMADSSASLPQISLPSPAQYAAYHLQHSFSVNGESHEVNGRSIPSSEAYTATALARSASAAGRYFGPGPQDRHRLHLEQHQMTSPLSALQQRLTPLEGDNGFSTDTVDTTEAEEEYQDAFPHDERRSSYDMGDDEDFQTHHIPSVSKPPADSNIGSDLQRKKSVTEQSFRKPWVMKSLNAMLLKASSNRPSLLDNPPRQFIAQTPTLQVINSNTVKERFLFLFNDLLILAKPLQENQIATETPSAPSGGRYLVKNIIELRKAALLSSKKDDEEEKTASKRKQHPVLLSFLRKFEVDADAAIRYLIERRVLTPEPTVIAHVLFKTPEVNKSQLGNYLGDYDHEDVFVAFTDRFRFEGIRIDEALRIFLMAFRMPTDSSIGEYMLEIFATRWHKANEQKAPFDRRMAFKLVLTMMALNTALNPQHVENPLDIVDPCPTSRESFIAFFREKDTENLVSDELLTKIYRNIRAEAFQTAIDDDSAQVEQIECEFLPPRPRTRLTLRSSSDEITVAIPKPDPNFYIKISGQDLRCEPTLLDFSQTNRQSFRVTGLSLGKKSLMFVKSGSNAKNYGGLPSNKTFVVERPFMRNTFQLHFVNSAGAPRKYMYSVDNAETLTLWTRYLEQYTNVSRREASKSKERRAAEAVALKTLKDSFIDDNSAQEKHVPLATNDADARATDARFELDGADLIRTTVQNSLLPVVLQFLKTTLDANPKRH